MLISTQTQALYNRFGLKKALQILSEVGFEAYDFSLFNLKNDDPFQGENFREYAREIRAYADSLGLVCNQTHAATLNSKLDRSSAEYQTLLRQLEISGLLGAKVAVVHPLQYLPYLKNREILKEINMDFYRGLIPYCEKFNIKVATENMWQVYYYNKWDNNICRSVCAAPEEFKDYLDTINSPRIVACLDVGHTSLVGEDMTEMIHALGPHLQALHLHDTDTKNDLHVAPFHGKIDFEEITQALADIDYQGDLTLETDGFYSAVPAHDLELNTATAAYLCATVKALRRRVEAKKQ